MPNQNTLSAKDLERVQRTQKGIAFQAWYDEIRNRLSGRSKEDQDALLANKEFCARFGIGRETGHGGSGRGGSALGDVQQKDVLPTAVHVDSLLSTFARMYANDSFIAEQCMPVVYVDARSNKYATYPKAERMSFPDDKVGYRGDVNEVDQNRSTDNYSVTDYALKDLVDKTTLDAQDMPLNEMLSVAEIVSEGLAFNREKRVSTIVQTSSNFAGNTAATTTPWDDASGGSVIEDMLAAHSGIWLGRGSNRVVGVCGLTVWNSCIVNNPRLKALFAHASDEGLVTPERFAKYFGLDAVIIGKSRENTANVGQTASYGRIWSTDVFSLLVVANAPNRASAHFGTTFRMNGGPDTAEWLDPARGPNGAIWHRQSIAEDHKVVAGDAGFCITNCIT